MKKQSTSTPKNTTGTPQWNGHERKVRAGDELPTVDRFGIPIAKRATETKLQKASRESGAIAAAKTVLLEIQKHLAFNIGEVETRKIFIACVPVPAHRPKQCENKPRDENLLTRYIDLLASGVPGPKAPRQLATQLHAEEESSTKKQHPETIASTEKRIRALIKKEDKLKQAIEPYKKLLEEAKEIVLRKQMPRTKSRPKVRT